MLPAKHGAAVAARDVEAACDAIEEFEETAKRANLTQALSPRMQTKARVDALRNASPTDR